MSQTYRSFDSLNHNDSAPNPAIGSSLAYHGGPPPSAHFYPAPGSAVSYSSSPRYSSPHPCSTSVSFDHYAFTTSASLPFDHYAYPNLGEPSRYLNSHPNSGGLPLDHYRHPNPTEPPRHFSPPPNSASLPLDRRNSDYVYGDPGRVMYPGAGSPMYRPKQSDDDFQRHEADRRRREERGQDRFGNQAVTLIRQNVRPDDPWMVRPVSPPRRRDFSTRNAQ